MDWYRAYHGLPTDPKWITVARRAGEGVTPGHVVAVWSALLDCASRAKPRGAVVGFQAEDIAASFGWPEQLVQAIVVALTDKRLIIDGYLAKWTELQARKEDTTATERKQRQRAKAKAKGDAAAEVLPAAVDATTHADMSRRDMRDDAGQSRVTPLEEKEQSNCSFSDASKQETDTSLKLDTSRTVRERASAVINPGDFWSWLAEVGVPANIGIRTMNRGRVVDWTQQGLTRANLDEALKRAQHKRTQERSDRPVNVGLLACFVDEVLAGTPAAATQTTGGRNERGDQLSREFAHVR
jgi:hypothetical protein